MAILPHHIVFIPGLGMNEALFTQQIDVLKPHAQCHIFDHQSHDNIEDMVTAFLATAPDNFTIVALSMGGAIAFEIMRQASDKVEKLVLIATSARGDDDEKAQSRYEMIELAQSGQFEQVIFHSYPSLVHPAFGDDPRLFSKVADMFFQTGKDVYIKQQHALLHRKASLDELATYECPTLIICGEQDQMNPINCSEEMASRINQSRLEILSGSGHLPPLEAFERVNELLIDFL